MIHFTKLGGVITILLILGCVTGVYAMLSDTPNENAWPPVGTTMTIVVPVPMGVGSSSIFTPKVVDTLELQKAYGNVSDAKSWIQLAIAEAYVEYEKHFLPADSGYTTFWKSCPAEERIYTAMVFKHLDFPGLRYGYGAIKKS